MRKERRYKRNRVRKRESKGGKSIDNVTTAVLYHKATKRNRQ
jgi:hypothetical protein